MNHTFLLATLLAAGLCQAQTTLIDVTFPDGTGTNPTFNEIDNGRGGGGTWDQTTGTVTNSGDQFSAVGASSELSFDPKVIGGGSLVLTTVVEAVTGAPNSNGRFYGFQTRSDSAVPAGGSQLWNNREDIFGFLLGGSSYGLSDNQVRIFSKIGLGDRLVTDPFGNVTASTASLADGFTVVMTIDSGGWEFVITGMETDGGTPITGASGSWAGVPFDFSDFANDTRVGFGNQGPNGQLDLTSITLEQAAPSDPRIALPSGITIANNGAPETIQVTVTNNGATQDLEVTGASVTGTDGASFSVTTAFPFTLPHGVSADLDIDVIPAGLPSAPTEIDALLEVSSSNADSATSPITGLKRDPWYESVAELDLGSITGTPGTKDFPIDITNKGATSDLIVDDAFLADGLAGYTLLGTSDLPATPPSATDPLVIPPLGTKQILLRFDAQGLDGDFADSLDVVSDDTLQDPLGVDLSIYVTRNPEISVTPAQDMGSFPHGSGPQPFAVRVDNLGAPDALTIFSAPDDPAFIAGDTANFSVDSFDASIPATSTGAINIVFDPLGGSGTFSATLEIQSDDTGASFVEVEVTATVLPPPGTATAAIDLTDSFGGTSPKSTRVTFTDSEGNEVVAEVTLASSEGGDLAPRGDALINISDKPGDLLSWWDNGGGVAEDATFTARLVSSSAEVNPASVKIRFDRIGIRFGTAFAGTDLVWDSPGRTTPINIEGGLTAAGSWQDLDDRFASLAGYSGTLAFSGDANKRYEMQDAGASGATLGLQLSVNFTLGAPIEITGVRHTGTAVEIDASGLKSDGSYQLTRSADLADGFPTVAEGPLVPGADTKTFTDSNPPAGKAFYRIEEAP